MSDPIPRRSHSSVHNVRAVLRDETCFCGISRSCTKLVQRQQGPEAVADVTAPAEYLLLEADVCGRTQSLAA